MRLFDYFFNRPAKNSAAEAKDRLQLVVAHQRIERSTPDYFPQLQREILEVIRKYVDIDETDLSMQLDHNDGCSILELNLPLQAKAKASSAVDVAAHPTQKNTKKQNA